MVKKVVLTMALCIALTGLNAQALTLSYHSDAPTIGSQDVYHLGESTLDQNNVEGVEGDPYGPDAATYIAMDRQGLGQTFTTEPGSYIMTGFWVKHVLYDEGEITWWNTDTAGPQLEVRVTDPSAEGTAAFEVSVETYTVTGTEADDSLIEGEGVSGLGTGTWVYFGLDTPVFLAGNTEYGFDVTVITGTGNYFFETAGLDGADSYTGGTAYSTGLSVGSNSLNMDNIRDGDHTFVVKLEASGDSPAITYPVGVENLEDYTPTLQWTDPDNYKPGVYYIYLDPNQDNIKTVSKMVEPDPGSPLLVKVSQLGSEPNEYTVTTELAHGERFYWKVEAKKTYPGEDPNYFSSVVASFTTMPDEPVIQEHPQNITVPKYSDAVFTIQALNAEEYHWYKVQAGNDVDVGEPNIPTLTITNVQKVDEGYYYCVVTNPNADVPSNTARLMVQRRVAWWNFDDQNYHSDIEHPADPNEDYFAGTYFDPNDSTPDPEFNNTNPSPAGGYYMVFSGDTTESEGDRIGEVVLVEPNEFFNFYPQGFTASAWVKVTGGTDWTGFLSKEYRIDPWSGWALLKNPYPENQAAIACRQTFAYYADVFSGVDLTQVNEDTGNTWHLVTGTYDTSVSRIYVDGNLGATSDSSTNVMLENTNPLVIGAETDEGFAAWDGQIDDVQIYNYPLSRYDVAKLYTDQVAGSDVCITDMEVDDSDLNDDCIVDMKDLAEFAIQWLDCGIVPTCIP